MSNSKSFYLKRRTLFWPSVFFAFFAFTSIPLFIIYTVCYLELEVFLNLFACPDKGEIDIYNISMILGPLFLCISAFFKLRKRWRFIKNKLPLITFNSDCIKLPYVLKRPINLSDIMTLELEDHFFYEKLIIVCRNNVKLDKQGDAWFVKKNKIEWILPAVQRRLDLFEEAKKVQLELEDVVKYPWL